MKEPLPIDNRLYRHHVPIRKIPDINMPDNGTKKIQFGYGPGSYRNIKANKINPFDVKFYLGDEVNNHDSVSSKTLEK